MFISGINWTLSQHDICIPNRKLRSRFFQLFLNSNLRCKFPGKNMGITSLKIFYQFLACLGTQKLTALISWKEEVFCGWKQVERQPTIVGTSHSQTTADLLSVNFSAGASFCSVCGSGFFSNMFGVYLSVCIFEHFILFLCLYACIYLRVNSE